MTTPLSGHSPSLRPILFPVLLPVIYFSIVGYQFLQLALSTLATTAGQNAGFPMAVVLFLLHSLPAWYLLWGTFNLKRWVRRWGMIFTGFVILVSGLTIRTWFVNLNRMNLSESAASGSLATIVIENGILILFSLGILILLYSKYYPEKVQAELAVESTT